MPKFSLRTMCNGAFELLKPLRFIISPSRRVIHVSIGVFFAVVFGSCSVGEFVGTYFNTYYNARRQFTEAEGEMLTQRDTRPGLDKTYLAPFLVQSTAKGKFTSVIEKCSKILQYHPQSDLVDDALMMIGKSYYYQNENQQAQRKFKELLDGYSESDLALEAGLLYAYTLYRTNDKVGAFTSGRELLEKANAADDDAMVSRASILLAHCELDNKNLLQARTYFETAAERGETAEERTTAFLNVAEMSEKENDFKRALDAYRQAEGMSPSYVLEYRSRLGQAKMLSKLGNHDAGRALLEELLANNNYREFFGEVNLEIGNTYTAMKDYAAAIEQYQYVDTTYARTETAANSYYQLGLLYETVYGNYDSAAVAYTRGKVEFPQAAIAAQLHRRSDYLVKYLSYRNEIIKFDSIRASLIAPKETTMVVQDTVAKDSALVQRTDKPDSLKAPPAPSGKPFTLDSVDTRLAFLKTELAALFYNTIEKQDSAKVWYRILLVDHPTSRFVPRAMFSLAQIYGQDSSMSATSIDSIYKEIIRRFPESDFAIESERLLGMPARIRIRDKADVVYARGEDLLEAGQVTAAIDTFRAVVRDYATSRIASKAQYAIGWIHERFSGTPDSAIANYQTLVALYPGSEYASLVRPKLSEVERFRNEQSKASNDTVKAGETIPEVKRDPEQVREDEAPLKRADPRKGKGVPDESTPPPSKELEENPKPQ